jgi:pilus assembly protein CpaC
VEQNKGIMVQLERPAASVVISDPVTADIQVVSPTRIFVRGKRVGETTLYAMDAKDEEILNAVIDVTHNISNLERAVRRVAPEAEVNFRTVDGGLVMDGFAGTVSESESIRDVASTFIGPNDKMVNMIKTNGSDQVMLRVKIVEMTRSNLKKLGVNLQNAFGLGLNSDLRVQVLQGADIGINNTVNNPITLGGTPTDRTGILDRLGSKNTNILFRWNDNRQNSSLEAIETQGLATVLAEPTLTTTTGKAASFLAGGQYPLPVQGQNGTVTVQYQPFGVSLNFTPVVMSKNRMSITIAPEVSSLSFTNPLNVSTFSYPILETRKASSVVELGSGDTFVLAGLLKSGSNTDISKTPGLGEIPVLGALFRSTQFQNNQSELVILVTPYIVHPVADKSLQTPLDGYVPPSDFQVLMNGELYSQQPMKKETQKKLATEPKLNGEGGFILD